MRTVIVFADVGEVNVGIVVEDILSCFWLFPELVQIPAGHIGQIIILDTARDGINCSQFECLFGFILRLTMVTSADSFS